VHWIVCTGNELTLVNQPQFVTLTHIISSASHSSNTHTLCVHL